jgi:catechol 2,3-dioxygenase-like lactoylglutathione lyase family enzyme
MSYEARRVARIDFTAADLDRTRRFYEGLGFTAAAEPAAVDAAELALLGLPEARAERLTLTLGTQEVSFLRFDPPGRPYPDDSTSTDLWFQHIAIAVSDMADAHARALAAGGRPITLGGPQTLPPNTGGVTAFKFRDPDGHPLELLLFPDGVGAPGWQARDVASPFLGIDHTALAVGEAGRAQAFFEALGLEEGGATHNQGIEQERLDDVPDDRCRVVPMRPPEAPPHVELLGYETGARRPLPARTRADDIWATRVWVEVASLSGDALTRAAALPGGVRAALRHDPDGHLVILMESGEPA